MQGEWASDRTVLAVTGSDAEKFLQDLVTNDVSATKGGLVYAALLSPKGKYLFDFFLSKAPDGFFVDIQTDRADALVQRLTMYRLRADVTISATEFLVNRGLAGGEHDPVPSGAFADPRHRALGWRKIAADRGSAAKIDWTAVRVANCIPKTGVELQPDDSYILESGFEALSGVDFRKGCYVGQEITARMKHKTELRKGLRTVKVVGTAIPGTEIRAGDKPAGVLYSQSDGRGIAYLRLDRAKGLMQAGDATVTLED